MLAGFALALPGCSHFQGPSSGTAGSSQPELRPNLLLVVVDDWALSDLEAARTDGNPWNNLVALDTLASQGQSWTSFYSQPLCNPTRLTLMLGSYIGGEGGSVCGPSSASTPEAATTLASILKNAGYATSAFGKWHIGTNPDPAGGWTKTPEAYGFDAWRAWNASNLGGHCGSKNYSEWQRVDDGVRSMSLEYHTEAVGLAFMDWWQATEGPRFAYVCFQAPHQPLHVPPAHLLPSGYPTPTTKREKYEAMLVAMDSMLASMLAVVDYRDTYVFVFGDNGTPPGAVRSGQRRSRVKKSTFEDGVNVPFLVVGPGVSIGETAALGHVVDFPATLATLAGASMPAGMPDSVSLVPVFENPAERVRETILSDNEFADGMLQSNARDTCVVIDTQHGQLKGRFFDDHQLGTVTRSFYDLGSDPRERSPLSEEDPVFASEIAHAQQVYEDYITRSSQP